MFPHNVSPWLRACHLFHNNHFARAFRNESPKRTLRLRSAHNECVNHSVSKVRRHYHTPTYPSIETTVTVIVNTNSIEICASNRIKSMTVRLTLLDVLSTC